MSKQTTNEWNKTQIRFLKSCVEKCKFVSESVNLPSEDLTKEMQAYDYMISKLERMLE